MVKNLALNSSPPPASYITASCISLGQSLNLSGSQVFSSVKWVVPLPHRVARRINGINICEAKSLLFLQSI